MPDVDVERLLDETMRRSRQLRARRRLVSAAVAVAAAAAIAVPVIALAGGPSPQGVIVSPGPSTSTTLPSSPSGGTEGKVVVPDVVGQVYLSTAQTALAGANLASRYELLHSTNVAAGTVIAEIPPAGSNVASGSTVTVEVSIGPAGIAGAQPCRSTDLKVQPGQPVSEATGQNTADWSFTNLGAACVLDGYPAVSAVDGQGRPLGFTFSHSGDQMTTGAAPQPVYLPKGSSAWLRLNKYRCDITVQGTTASITFALPAGGGSVTTSDLPRAFDYCSETPSLKITVSPFEPVEMLLSPA